MGEWQIVFMGYGWVGWLRDACPEECRMHVDTLILHAFCRRLGAGSSSIGTWKPSYVYQSPRTAEYGVPRECSLIGHATVTYMSKPVPLSDLASAGPQEAVVYWHEIPEL